MRVIAKPALVAFWKRHPDAEKPLMTWHKLVRQHSPANFAQLKQLFPAADAVDNFVVFDIGGNKYRIVARVLYTLQVVFIRNVLTHAEYDAWRPDQDAWSKKGQQKTRQVQSKKPKREQPQTSARKRPTKGGKGKP